VKQLIQETGESHNRITAALHQLRLRGAVEAMEVEGQLFWYLTPELDRRSRVVNEIKADIHHTKKRRIGQP